MDISKWFLDRRGLLTYSMYGSRNGTDGTADCSGSISQALKDNGFNIDGLPSTVTLPNQLEKVGWVRISVNEDWKAKKDDIVLCSFGIDMSQSGGAGGHVGVMLNETDFISVDYTTGGQTGTAVSMNNWNEYYTRNGFNYIEVWRYDVIVKQNYKIYKADSVKYVNDCYQIKCDDLCPLDFDWTENGIPVSLVNWVDGNGNNVTDGKDEDFKSGMHFTFEIDENQITDTGEGGNNDNGYYYRAFNFGQFGIVWLSAWDKNDLIYK